jgi:drug/metabolite transporter (DMT)-like permease
MTNLIKIILLSFIMLVVTITGDYYVKKASIVKDYSDWRILLLGATIYFISAFGWFWIYRFQKFLTVGAIHSFGIIMLTVLFSIFVFKEKINGWEIFGLVLGAISLTILVYNGKL